MLETGSTSPRTRQGSGSEPGACPAFLNPPAFRLQGCELVASAHWWVATQVRPHQVPAGFSNPQSLCCVEQNNGLCQGRRAVGALPGLDGSHLTGCQEKSVPHNSNEFCILGGEINLE